MTAKYIVALVSVLSLSACDKGPPEVYVPLTEPEVELKVRASATEVSVGEPVTLYAERWNHGKWILVERKELASEQCWLRHPPEYHERDVADNLRWEAIPSKGVRFNVGVRVDHARTVIFENPGEFILESRSKVWCRPDKEEKGRAIKISVRS